jgi:hypothetical protein
MWRQAAQRRDRPGRQEPGTHHPPAYRAPSGGVVGQVRDDGRDGGERQIDQREQHEGGGEQEVTQLATTPEPSQREQRHEQRNHDGRSLDRDVRARRSVPEAHLRDQHHGHGQRGGRAEDDEGHSRRRKAAHRPHPTSTTATEAAPVPRAGQWQRRVGRSPVSIARNHRHRTRPPPPARHTFRPTRR